MRTLPKRIHWSEATLVVKQAGMSTAPPHYFIPSTWFARRIVDFDLWLVCDGQAELLHTDGGKSTLGRGSVVLIAPGDASELRVNGSGSYTNCYIHFDLVDRKGRFIPPAQVDLPPSAGYVHDIHYFESTMRRIMYLQYQRLQSPAAVHAAIGAQVSHLLTGLLYDYQLSHHGFASPPGLAKHHFEVISSALSWLYLHPESAESASGLAKKYGYSPRHFCRIFREVTGKTPGRVLIEARIDHAKKLLATSALNISEIAESLGYENVFYFSRQFKQLAGLSPARFRSRLPALTREG